MIVKSYDSGRASNQARSEARAAGWKRRQGRDLCADCAEANR